MENKSPKTKKPAAEKSKHEVAKKTEVKTKARKTAPVKREVKLVLGLHNLKSPLGSHKKRKYLGRGSSSGHGKTSTRGSKGQTSRAGRHFYLGFEGGQSPLIRRMPKRGFTSNFKKIYQIINLENLVSLKETTITPDLLEERGLIKDKNKLIKILGNGEIKNPINVSAHAFSKKAASSIIAAGGKTEIININV